LYSRHLPLHRANLYTDLVKSKVTVLGSGAWGTAIAKAAAENGADVTLWCRDSALAADINASGENRRNLAGVRLPKGIRAVSDIEEAAAERDYLILAVPSLYLLETVKRILAVPSIREGETAIAVLTKGFLPGKTADAPPRLIIETLEDYLPGFYQRSLVYIAGPSHAEEVSRGKITGLIAASENAKNSFRFRDLLKNRRLLVYSSLDVRGVQVSAAVKNVIAIAFGMMDALKENAASKPVLKEETLASAFGDGTASLLLAAGLNEILTLGKSMGATHAETFTSISGVGDLDVTCRSVFGRNRRFGRDIIEKDILSRFHDIDDLLSRITELGYLPEGAAAARHVHTLAEVHNLKMPISGGVYRVLNRETTAQALLGELW